MSEESNDATRRTFLQKGATLAGSLTAGASLSAQSKKLRIGVVGGGFGSSFPWHMHPNCVVTAVADLREDRRKRLMDRFDCSNSYAEFHPMLKDPKVDAVAIYTPAVNHVSHSCDVMNSGRHVISAVPAANTLEDCQKLVDTVKKTGQIYMMAETSCFHAPTMAAREWRKQGKFGKLYYTEGCYLHDHGSFLMKGTASKQLMDMFVQDGKPTWRYGNAPGLYITHASGPCIYVSGEKYTEVSAIGTPIDHEFYKKNQYNNPFICMNLFFKTDAGNSSRIAIHWWTAAPGREGADYYGTEMSFFEPRFGQPAIRSYPGQKPENPVIDNYASILPANMRDRVNQGHGGAEVFIVNEFVSACLENRKPAIDVYNAVAFTAPGICGQQSAMKGGAWIKVPDFGAIS
ncbi:MAG: Gfo/Idh/MocA family oxidoreductase [Bryobacteraceae bacterium]